MSNRALGGLAHGGDVVSIHRLSRNGVGGGAARNVVSRDHVIDPRGNRVAVVLADVEDGQPPDSGKVERGLKRVSLSDWQESMKTKGIPRIARGLDSARSKIENFNREFYPFLEGVDSKVNAMPDTTLEDGINRMVTNVREIAKFKRSG